MSLASSGRPRAAARASPFRSIPVTSSTSSASWPPPSLAATWITSGPPRLIRSWVYDGPSSMPSASTARRATSAAASAWTDGQTWTSGTPNASPSAEMRSVTARGTNSPRRGEAADRHLRPVEILLDEDGAAAGGGARSLDRRPEAAGAAHQRKAGPRGAVGGLHDRGERRIERLVLRRDLPSRLGNARLGERLTLAELVRRENRGRRTRSDAGSPSFSAIRAATATGGSVPGEMTPSIGSAEASRSRAGSSSVRDDAPPVCQGEAGSPGSRSQTAVQMPWIRAASSSPSWAGPAPRTRSERLWSGGSPTTGPLSARNRLAPGAVREAA